MGTSSERILDTPVSRFSAKQLCWQKLDFVKAGDRARRDEQVFALWAGGWSYRRIADHVGLRSPQSVANIVNREAPQRKVLRDRADAVFLERTEALLRANWPAALRGDYQASVACIRVLDRQARYFGLYNRSKQEPDGDEDD